MTDLTPRSQKIPIENSPFSSATHLNSLNFSIFTQKYYELRSLKQNDQQSLTRKRWLKITRNYLKVERNNILFNFCVAKKIHESRKKILQSHFLSEWHQKFIKRKNQEALDENQLKNNDQIIERKVETIKDEENSLNNIENSTPASPLSPNSKKVIRKHYSDKSTDTTEIPDLTLAEKIKAISFKKIVLSLIIITITCIGTYFGFHYYFKHNKYHQLYKKHKYEATLPPHENEADAEVVIDYSKVFPEDGDLVHVMKKLIKKVKNIKSKQIEMNEQVQNIQESLDEKEKKDNQQIEPNEHDFNNKDTLGNEVEEGKIEIQQTNHDSSYSKSDDPQLNETKSIDTKNENNEQVK